MRTSISGSGSLLAARRRGLAALVYEPVHVVAERDVEQQREGPEAQCGADGLVEQEDRHDDEDDRGDRRPVGGRPPARRAVHALGPPLGRRLLALRLLALLGCGLAAGAPARLDRARGGPAVLGAALALGLGHGSRRV